MKHVAIAGTTDVCKKRTLLVSVFVTAVLLFAILAVIVGSGVTNALDSSILLAINSLSSPWLNTFFVAFTELGGVIVVSVVAIILVLLFLTKRNYIRALLIAVGIGGVAAMNLLLKSIFERARPDLWDWIVTETHTSFPSGHATASMALALCIVYLLWNTKWRKATIIAASVYLLLIGFSRLYLGVHFPTDILGGWLLGIGWMALVITFVITVNYRKRIVKGDV
jgi:undecaprenyl-diphosphatase